MKQEDLRSLVQRRLEQARDALSDAQKLLGAGGSSMSIVNRLYYAGFYTVSALLLTQGKSSAKHSGVVSLFNREFILPGIFPREMGRFFNRLFDLRQKSDYEVTAPVDADRHGELFEQTDRFFKTLHQYLAENGWT